MRPPEILKRIKELNKVWREQNFVYTPEQQAEFDQLKQLRRERVKYFHKNGLVSKGGSKQNVDVT